ncbi:MAG TPA: tetratricopeptide repeat protein [Kofleriaceae bacterium]|nr:tetratricopeptide repeat protein [Kofleriaceae bacterium]
MKRFVVFGFLCAALWLSPRALAQPTGDKVKAKALYDKGNVQYNLGRWKEAIDLFTQAYEAYDNPDLLFNIGQAYRQDGNCSRAIFFYKRYLALKPNAPNKAEVEKFIEKLQPGCVEEPEPKEQPKEQPKEITQPETSPAVEKKPEPLPPDEEYEDEEVEVSHPRIVSLRAAGGPSYLSAGGDLDKLLLGISAGAAYPIYVDKVGIEPGVLVSYSPVPWDNETTGASGTVGLIGLLANAGITYPLAPRLGLRGDAGAGVLVLSGVTKVGNPFLEMGDTADGALSKFHLRLAAGIEFMVAPGFILSAQPVISYSPSGSDLNSEISSITRFEALIGAGYRM